VGVLVGVLLFVVIKKLIIYYNDALDVYLSFDIMWFDYLLLVGICCSVDIQTNESMSEKPKTVYFLFLFQSLLL